MAVGSDAHDYQHIFTFFQTTIGLRVHNGRADDIMSLIDDVLASMNLAGTNDLARTLANTPFTDPLWQTFIRALTVGETYFYRDQGQIDTLRADILPQLIAERRESGRKTLRLWSAGCASGEEPYTLVMLLYELLPDIEDWHITVLGTDINLTFLERARHGIYRASSFRNETPDYVQQRWFTPVPGGYQLAQAVRDKVTFVPLNLANISHALFDTFTMNMDLIVCRNVTIYFGPDTVRELVSQLHRALADRGRLIVGHSELSTTTYNAFTTRSYGRNIYYQKNGVVPKRHVPVPHPPSKRPVVQAAARATKQTAPPEPVPPPDPLTDTAPDVASSGGEDQDLERAWSRAKAAADREKWDEALAYLAQVESAHLFRPEFHYLRGLVQMAAENADQALWAWRQALYCDPAFALAHYSLGELFERQGEQKAAARHWHQALAALANLDPQQVLLVSEDLTVEMLQGLLTYRLSVSDAERAQF